MIFGSEREIGKLGKQLKCIGPSHNEDSTIPLKGGYDSFSLLSQKLVNIHKQNYKFMHLGMIQVGLKPLTRLGLNTSALILVRDQRHNKFEDS